MVTHVSKHFSCLHTKLVIEMHCVTSNWGLNRLYHAQQSSANFFRNKKKKHETISLLPSFPTQPTCNYNQISIYWLRLLSIAAIRLRFNRGRGVFASILKESKMAHRFLLRHSYVTTTSYISICLLRSGAHAEILGFTSCLQWRPFLSLPLAF